MTLLTVVVFISLHNILYGKDLDYHGLEADDVLTPYDLAQRSHGPRILHRQVRECMEHKYGNRTHEVFASDKTAEPPFVTNTIFIDDYQVDTSTTRRLYGHVSVVRNPAAVVSVLEPLERGGCAGRLRATVADSSRQKSCEVAINAGFFDTHTGECLGNLVSDGRVVTDSRGVQNAHFGIRKSGQLFWGYLSEEELYGKEDPFQQLVGGVIWLLRDGEIYVNQSQAVECDQTEETGSASEFVEVVAGRTAVGHDSQGRLVLVQVDGQTHSTGVNLWQMAEFLQRLGLVNAINLDGGGSTTYALNGTTVNYPTDRCPGEEAMARCAREVSSVLCVHQPECQPPDCSGHGRCLMGRCQCLPNWNASSSCDTLTCAPHNCNQHGNCTPAGCVCAAGWEGEDCHRQCPPGHFGPNCGQLCQCQNQAPCSPISGQCHCPPGFIGQLCQNRCAHGYYGDGCRKTCACGDAYCACDPVTGACNLSNSDDPFYLALYKSSQCLAINIIGRENLVPSVPLLYNLYFWGMVVMAAVALVSLSLNLLTFCYSCKCSCATPAGAGGGSARRPALGHYRQVYNQDILLDRM